MDVKCDLYSFDPKELVGHDFMIIVKDKFAHQYLLGGAGVRRVIKEEILFESPAIKRFQRPHTAMEDVCARVSVHFFFIQVYTEEITPQIVYQKSDIPASAASHTVETPSGIYFYRLKAGGEFVQVRRLLRLK